MSEFWSHLLDILFLPQFLPFPDTYRNALVIPLPPIATVFFLVSLVAVFLIARFFTRVARPPEGRTRRAFGLAFLLVGLGYSLHADLAWFRLTHQEMTLLGGKSTPEKLQQFSPKTYRTAMIYQKHFQENYVLHTTLDSHHAWYGKIQYYLLPLRRVKESRIHLFFKDHGSVYSRKTRTMFRETGTVAHLDPLLAIDECHVFLHSR